MEQMKELGKQWANNKLLTSLKDNPGFLAVLEEMVS